MDFDIYFPLFNEILHGSLNPERPENAVGKNYGIRLQEQIVGDLQPMGAYSLQYLKPINQKTSYYRRMLLSETNGYCLDALEYLPTQIDVRIRTYLRDQILDKHLTTCLMRLGEKINTENYRLDELRKPAIEANLERLSNIYIFHLLKVCLAKAYMEVQAQLYDVLTWKYTEGVLYSSFVGEIPGMKCFLKRLTSDQIKSRTKTKIQVQDNDVFTRSESLIEKKPNEEITEKQNGTVGSIFEKGFAETCYTVKEVAKKLNRTETTILRNIKSEKIKASFDGSMYWINREWFDAYMATLMIAKKLK